MMKRTALFLAAASFAVLLSACGNKTEKKMENNAATAEQSQPAQDPAASPTQDPAANPNPSSAQPTDVTGEQKSE